MRKDELVSLLQMRCWTDAQIAPSQHITIGESKARIHT
jgi:hypothetical protein